MKSDYLKVEGHADLVRDTQSHAIINTNIDAYERAKKRAAAAQRQRHSSRAPHPHPVVGSRSQ